VVPRPRRRRPLLRRADVRHPWRLLPIGANGQLAFACYQGDPDGDRFRLGAVNVLRVRAGRIVELAGFLDPAVHRHFGLPAELTDDSRVGGDSTYP
jgi:ketosteroid isomerase-like protein